MIGSTISHYRIVSRLGRGAMGLVYKAQDLQLDRPVAIKFISHEIAAVPEQRTRFIREARTASVLDHPNICTIHAFDETKEGDLFIVMAFCPGENLRVRLEQGPLSLKHAANIAEQVARGLANAHSMGIVHRDIKPANIMLLPDGGVKIVDFGLAKLPHDVGLTNTGGVVGTVPYMSPEQLRGDPLDARTDIWSWGVTFYEMLAGDRPFESKTEATIMRAIMDQEPPSLRARRPDLPAVVEQIISQSLRKNRDERPASARELVEALHSLTLRTDVAPVITVAPRPHASVAVLPFLNMAPDHENDYFSDGLTEELIHALSRLPGLQVVSRTSAFEFKGKAQNIRTIGEQLKVSTVVEGSVRKVGDRIRVNTQLVNVSDGYTLWSERFDCNLTDIFDVQDNMARSIADMLKVELGSKAGSSGLVKRYTDNFEAYDLYLRGRFQWNKRSPEGFQKALEYFQRALERDPNYAPALAGIADYYVSVASWGLAPPTVAWPEAKDAITKALAADDSLAEAHASLGMIHMWYEWNWKAAEREFLRAIELNQGLPLPHIYYNLLLVQTGRSDEAEVEVCQALANDPLSVPANIYLAGVYHYRRDYDGSLKQARRALDLDANDIEAHVVLALNYEQQRKYKEAIAELEKAHKLADYNPLLLGPLASCYGGSGDREKALMLLDELNAAAAQAYVAPISWVMIYLGLGDLEHAFEWLDKAAEARDPLLCYLKVGPIYDAIRADPRYADLLYRIGLAQDVTSELRTVTQHAGASAGSEKVGGHPAV
jgi:serine/threonine protein kinase/tetratricopeptide (TPR) repeat protein